MSMLTQPFDPSAKTSGVLQTLLSGPSTPGVLLILNDSAVNLTLTLNDGQRDLPAQTWRRIDLPDGDQTISWAQQSILNISPPNSQVYGEVYFAYEDISEVFPASVIRAVVGVTNVATQVINTGNGAEAIVVQATNINNGGSLTEFNDGSGSRKILDAGNVVTIEFFTAGTNLAEAVAAYGTPTDLTMTTFNGEGNFDGVSLNSIKSMNGTTAAGPLWVPVQTSIRQHITSTGLTNIISFSAPITGLYRISANFNKRNATSAAVTFEFTYTDPDDSSSHTIHLSADIAGTYTNFAGSTTVGSAVAHCFVVEFPATVSTTISCQYNDPSGTPNDFVSAVIECLL